MRLAEKAYIDNDLIQELQKVGQEKDRDYSPIDLPIQRFLTDLNFRRATIR